MKYIENEDFWDNLTSNFKKSFKDYMDLRNSVNSYQNAQLWGCIIITVIFLIYSGKDIISNKFSFENLDFFVFALIVGLFFTVIEKSIAPLKKDMNKAKETVRNRMIIKICDCPHYCECKEQFNSYVESKGIKILN